MAPGTGPPTRQEGVYTPTATRAPRGEVMALSPPPGGGGGLAWAVAPRTERDRESATGLPALPPPPWVGQRPRVGQTASAA